MTGHSNYIDSDADTEEIESIDNDPFALMHISSETTLFFNYSPSLIGRNRKKCHLILGHPSISQVHCALFWSENKLCICDLGSQTGVHVNGKRVKSQNLNFGDQIQIGNFQFRYVELANQTHAADMLQETKSSSSDARKTLSELDGDIELSESDNGLEQFELDSGIDLDEYSVEEGFSTYSINRLLPVSPEEQKRRNYSLSDEETESTQDVRTAFFSISDFKNKSLLRRIAYAAVFVVFLLGLKIFWLSDNSDYEIYNALQSRLNAVKSYRSQGAGPIKWEILANNIHAEFQPIISSLEKKTNANSRVKQELLIAARDYLPKVLQESRREVSRNEERFVEHLENARMILENDFRDESDDRQDAAEAVDR